MQQRVIFKTIFNRKNKLRKDGTALIQIEAYLNPSRKYFSTGIYVKFDEWDNKRKIISRKRSDYARLNNIIKQQVSSLEKIELEALNKGMTISLDIFNVNKAMNFFEYFEKYKIEKKISKSRRLSINRAIKYLSEYNKLLTFETFKYPQIVEYDDFLRNQKKLAQNSIANHHKIVKAFLNHALKADIIQKNPYIKFKIIKEKVNTEFLTIDEINRIEEIDENFISETVFELREMFLFSCYTGLRFSDVQSLTKDMFYFDDKEVYMTFKQTKTNSTQNRIPLHLLFNGKPVEIIKNHINNEEKYVFDRFTNQNANRLLKVMQPMAKITKSLTFHLSRHTFGTQVARLTNDPFLIKELMGHADIKTSMIYIHLNNQAMSDKLKNVKW